MRLIFSIASILIALAIVGVLAKKQLAPTRGLPAVPGQPASAGANGNGKPGVRQESAQMQQQVKQAVEASLQQARPMPEDDK